MQTGPIRTRLSGPYLAGAVLAMTEMRTPTWTVVLLVLVVGVSPVLPLVGAAPPAPNQATEDSSAGATLAEAVSVQGANLSAEVEERALSVSLERSDREAYRSVVLRNRVETGRQRLAELEHRRETLEAARDNGEVGPLEYRVRRRSIRAEIRTVTRVLLRSEEAATALPSDTRQQYGIDNETFDTLFDRAHSLERNMTWVSVQRSETQIDIVESNLSVVEDYADSDNEEAQRALDCARDHVSAANDALARARQASQQGDVEAVRNAVAEVEDHLAEATRCLREAIQAIQEDQDGETTPTPTRTWTGDSSTYDTPWTSSDSTDTWSFNQTKSE